MTGDEFARATQFLTRRVRNDLVEQLIESETVVRVIHKLNGPGRPSYTIELVK